MITQMPNSSKNHFSRISCVKHDESQAFTFKSHIILSSTCVIESIAESMSSDNLQFYPKVLNYPRNCSLHATFILKV